MSDAINEPINHPPSKQPVAVDRYGNEIQLGSGGGNGGGFTGFNPEAAATEIRSIMQTFQAIINSYWSANRKLFDEDFGLHYVWCSPNAVVFYNTYLEKINEFGNKMQTIFDARISSLKRGFNIIAYRNNCPNNAYPTWPVEIQDVDFQFPPLLEKHPNGSVGINKTLAELVRDTYHKKISECIEDISKIPAHISFYDESGAQQNAFAARINELKVELTQLMEGIDTSIATAISEEIHNDLLAKQRVVNTLAA